MPFLGQFLRFYARFWRNYRKQEALPTLKALSTDIGKPKAVAMDNGYFSETNIQDCEKLGIEPYIATGREPHHLDWHTFFQQQPEPPPDEASALVQMTYKLQTEIGKTIYRLRKCTIEPIIGIIKEILGFRQFSLRGLLAAAGEWALVCLAFNLKRLHSLFLAQGRLAVDSVYYCYHGEMQSNQCIVDWQPFEEYTMDSATPIGVNFNMTFKLKPVKDGTQLINLWGKARGAWIMCKISDLLQKLKFVSDTDKGMERLRQRIQQDLADGIAFVSPPIEMDTAQVASLATQALTNEH